MAQNFYQTGGSYYTADTHQKILTPADLQKKAQAGGKEVPYTTFQQPAGQAIPHPDQIPNYNVTGRVGGTLYGTPKIDSNTLSVGSQTGNLSNQLPDVSATQSAIDIYSNQALSDGTQSLTQLQQQLAQLNAQSLQGNQAEQGRIQGQLDQTYARRDQDIADYRSMTDPLFKQGVDEYKRMTDALGQIDYSALINQRLGLTNDIVEYSKLMRADLDAEAGRPAVASVYYGRQAAIQQNYLSKISTAQAALQAIDGNFNLAQDIMNNGARMIQNISQDRLQFLNFVEGLYGQDIAIGETKLLNLKQEEKEQINELKNKLQSDIQRIEENKAIIQNLLADPATAVVASKAGLTLTDTMDEVAEKLNRFYVANPQYLPENVAAVRQLMTQFPDAGIQPTDTIQQAQAKLRNSRMYQQSTQGGGFNLIEGANGEYFNYDPATGLMTPVSGDTSSANVDQIAQAIRQIESNNNYNAKGGSGEFGAYQFMPATWNGWSSEYARNVLNMNVARLEPSQANQDAVAKYKIQQWLNEGLSPQDIAAKWNSGSHVGWQNKIGVNKHGVAYNVPNYVKKFSNALGSIVGPTQSSPQDVSPMAMMVIENPSLLSDLTPTERGNVMKEIASAGGMVQTAAQQSALHMLNEAIELLPHIDPNTPGFKGAVGRPGITSFFGLKKTPWRGSSARDFMENFETFKAKLVLPNLEFVRGLGRMSQEQFNTLKQATDALTLNLSEAQFKSHYSRLVDSLNNLQADLSIMGTSSLPQNGKANQFQLPDGRIVTLQSDGTYR